MSSRTVVMNLFGLHVIEVCDDLHAEEALQRAATRTMTNCWRRKRKKRRTRKERR